MGVSQSKRETRSEEGIEAPRVPVPSLPRGRGGSCPDGHVLAFTQQKLILFLLKEEGATSREGNIGFLRLKTEEIPSYQQKSSPKVTAVILPMAFSPACPHKEAFKRSCLQT